MKRLLLPLASLGIFLASTQDAWAQPQNPPPTQENANPQATIRTEGGRRVYVATETFVVHGEIQRPYAFSVTSRSSLGYSYLEVPVHFVQEIINAVRRAPF